MCHREDQNLMETESDSKKRLFEVLRELQEEEKQLDLKLSQLNEAAQKKIEIMNALHDYNDIKDATQVVLGQLADLHGVTVKELHQKYDLPTDD